MNLRMFVPGRPAPQGSKRHVGGGRMIESSKYVAPWRETVRHHAATQMAGNAPIDGPATVRVTFVLPRPKSEPKSTRPHTRRPDLDKLARAVLDALTGPAILDDSQVVRLDVHKRTAQPEEPSGAVIEVAATNPKELL